MVNHYLIATAPCTLGFLWGVTDRDVDKWTVTLLKHWIEGKRGNNKYFSFLKILDRHQVWRSHDPTSVQTFDFCEKRKRLPSLF